MLFLRRTGRWDATMGRFMTLRGQRVAHLAHGSLGDVNQRAPLWTQQFRQGSGKQAHTPAGHSWAYSASSYS